MEGAFERILNPMIITCLRFAVCALIGSTSLPATAMANGMVDSWLSSLYVSTFVGGHFLPDIETETLADGAPYSDEIYEQDTGFAARFAVGGRVNEHIRAELELGFNRTGQGAIIEVRNGTRSPNTGHGEFDTVTLFTNIWADLPVFGASWGLTPYVGGGFGAALVDPNLVYTAFPTYGPQESSVELAAQLGAGVNWAFNERFALGLGYRVMVINGPDISQPTATEISTYRFDPVISQSVGITLTMNLN